jgi:hypothetical protein
VSILLGILVIIAVIFIFGSYVVNACGPESTATELSACTSSIPKRNI